MATPPSSEQLAADFNCETPTCKNPYRVISLMVGDSTAHYHCLGCWMAWNAAIIKGLVEQGLITAPEQLAASAGT